MSANIDHLSAQLGSLPNDNPAKVIGAIAINGMWFIHYVQKNDPELYARARSFSIDCTQIAGVSVTDEMGMMKVEPDDPPAEDWQ